MAGTGAFAPLAGPLEVLVVVVVVVVVVMVMVVVLGTHALAGLYLEGCCCTERNKQQLRAFRQ